ncbi:hypothetical protein [Pedobacter sp. SL55]|uniref:hypothetical protein n=1 Tax=Pedobacter sp. SL55 TaxID=2995161 RepID=UPI002D1E403C|nr:hypothetical protein [Pedobacter sp. SL55]
MIGEAGAALIFGASTFGCGGCAGFGAAAVVSVFCSTGAATATFGLSDLISFGLL